MGSRELKVAYKETRLNLEPSPSSSLVQIRIQSPGASRRSNSHRTNGAYSVAEDERTYRARNLATTSSIYHRKYHNSPRSFLWRILENEIVLSIRVADVCKEQNDPDATLVLNLQFPSPLRASCLDFADSKEHDALTVFVVDQANQLYTITLRPDAFRKRAATEGGLGDACKPYSPPGFGFKHPHRLIAVNTDQLVVTMHDGGILKFDRNKSHDATSASLWKETIYNVAGWGQSLRGLVPFQRNPTVKYDKINMELTAAASTAVTTMGHDEAAFLFTVCLDHRMRIWDVRNGQILYTGDILNSDREPHELGKWTIDPAQSNLMRLVGDVPGQRLVVTYSPVGAGQFKFWEVKANDQGSIHVADCFPRAHLIPPTPSADVWTLADFAVINEREGVDLWILWKNNITYRTQKLHVRPQGAGDPFGDGWKAVFVDHANPPAEGSGPCDSVDVTEKWLDAILHPGRFPRSTIETALATYEKGLGTGKESRSKGSSKSLAESICSVIGATAALGQQTKQGMGYEQFRNASETQWLRFWRLLLDIDKLGGEALSIVLDDESGTVWVVCAGCVASVRECSSLERVYHNLRSPDFRSKDVATIVSTGEEFYQNFTAGMRQLSRAALQAELFEDPGKSDLDRMQSFVDKAGFWRQLSDEDCNSVVAKLNPDFSRVSQELYDELFELVLVSGALEPRYPLTEFGRKLVMRAVQGAAELQWQILFSQLLLLVHMEIELDNNEDEALHSRFDVGNVYKKLLGALRRLEHVKWMTNTEMSLTNLKSDRTSLPPGSESPSASKRGTDEPRPITPLEGLLGHLFGLADIANQALIQSLTDLAVNLCAPNSDTELIPHLQQCWLLKIDRPDLALALSHFNEPEPFATYIQGRVLLALKDFDAAAVHFKKASIGLSIPSQRIGRHSAGLLDDTEWNLLGTGLPNYYTHIVNLFDKHRAHSFVLEFASLGLQFARSTASTEASTKTELSSRLFTASLAVSHFDVAHSTLLSMDDEALQTSYLRKLIERMCETGQNAELVSLPFSGLQNKVDEILSEKCKATKNVTVGVPYHQILYAWRISHNDYRGGAAILLDRLQKLKASGEGDKPGTDDVMDTQVTRQYLLLINALSCVPGKDVYVLADVLEPSSTKGKVEDELDNSMEVLAQELSEEAASAARPSGEDTQLAELMTKFERRPHRQMPPRKLLTLTDLRKHYQQELDRIVAIQANQFGFTGEDDAMDIA